MNRLLIFFFLNVFVTQAQKDSVRLVDIQSSECGGDYYIRPHFLSRETVGDTTFVRLSCTNNCSGYHNPSVSLFEDSIVRITVPPGTEVILFKLLNGEYVDENEIILHPKDSILEEVIESYAMCDCCYTFDLKILGLHPSKNYSYFYNEQFIDLNYKAPVPRKPFVLQYFLKQSKSEVCKKVKRIASKDKELLESWDGFAVYLQIDTLNGSIKSITTDLEDSKESINQKLIEYFYSLKKIDCVTNPYNGKLIMDYTLLFLYDPEIDKLHLGCTTTWPL